MKKLLCSIVILLAVAGQAQVIDRNDIIIHAGGGLGIFRYHITDITNSITSERDTSGAWTFPVQVEYGINRWLGAGVNFTYHNFLQGDSSANDKATVSDFALSANLHIPWSLKKFDFCANIGYGYSRFKYVVDEVNNPIAKAGGSVLLIGVNPRLYFREDGHVGLTMWYHYTKHIYNNGEVADDNGFSYKFKLDGPGNSFGLGLIVKI